jgi:hypothetical protein
MSGVPYVAIETLAWSAYGTISSRWFHISNESFRRVAPTPFRGLFVLKGNSVPLTRGMATDPTPLGVSRSPGLFFPYGFRTAKW